METWSAVDAKGVGIKPLGPDETLSYMIEATRPGAYFADLF